MNTKERREALYDYWVTRIGVSQADYAAALADVDGDLAVDGPHRWNPEGGDVAYAAWQADDRMGAECEEDYA